MKKSLFGIVISIFLLSSCASFLTLGEHFEAGVEDYKNGDYNSAVEHFEYILSKDGTNVIAINNLASIYIMQDRLTDAATELRQAIKTKPDYPESHYNMGIVYIAIGMWPEALEEFKTVLSLISESRESSQYKADLYYYIGSCLDEIGEWKEAVSYLERALFYRPSDEAAMLRLAHLYYYLEKYEMAKNLVRNMDSHGYTVGRAFRENLNYYLGLNNGYNKEPRRGSRRKRRALGKNKQNIRME